MTTPSEDEGMQIVRPDKPRRRLLQTAITNPELQGTNAATRERANSSPARRIAVVAGIALVLIILAGGVAYWIEWQRYPVVVTIGVPDTGAAGDPLARRRGPLVPVAPDMLHVSSIALGNPHLTIVNGKRLAEGEWLVVTTPLGEASVRIIQIEDGVVRFRHGGETISAKLQAAQKTAR
jgi:hypothetical protein